MSVDHYVIVGELLPGDMIVRGRRGARIVVSTERIEHNGISVHWLGHHPATLNYELYSMYYHEKSTMDCDCWFRDGTDMFECSP